MAEMARVLRPSSGRAVLLVAQPHLLGVPGLERDSRKDRKKLRKKKRQTAGNAVGPQEQANEEATPALPEDPERCGRKGGGKAMSRPVGSSTSSRGLDEDSENGMGNGAHKDQALQTDIINPATPAPEKRVGVEHQQEPEKKSADEPEDLWRVRSLHTVNVGGLMSSLLVLDRTGRPSALPHVDRRKRLVGLDAYCKRRREGQSSGDVGPS